MSTILLVIHILLAIALVGVILIQRNEGGLGGLGGGGGGGGMMSGRSAANLLTRATAIIATLFIVNSVALAIVGGTERSSILRDDDAPAMVTPASEPGGEVPAGETAGDDGPAADRAGDSESLGGPESMGDVNSAGDQDISGGEDAPGSTGEPATGTADEPAPAPAE